MHHLWVTRYDFSHRIICVSNLPSLAPAGISDAYYCAECTRLEKDRDGCPKIVNLGASRTDLFYERRRLGTRAVTLRIEFLPLILSWYRIQERLVIIFSSIKLTLALADKHLVHYITFCDNLYSREKLIL